MGIIVMVKGVLATGCPFFVRYLITPQNKIPERMSIRLLQIEGRFIQMEDKIGSISAILAAAMIGLKAISSISES